MGPAFRVFCQDVLGLRWGLTWRKVEATDRAWFAGKTEPNAILLVGSITVAGEALTPNEDLTCVSFVDRDGTLRLSTHALRHGLQGVDVYRLFLIGLSGLRLMRSPLLPQPRIFAAEVSDLLPQYQDDVDPGSSYGSPGPQRRRLKLLGADGHGQRFDGLHRIDGAERGYFT